MRRRRARVGREEREPLGGAVGDVFRDALGGRHAPREGGVLVEVPVVEIGEHVVARRGPPAAMSARAGLQSNVVLVIVTPAWPTLSRAST
jgi:hypothetical protein